MKKEKKVPTTLETYKKWRNIDILLNGGKYVAPVVPAVIITGINWEEWFAHTGVSLPFGFAALIIAILSTVLAMAKSDKERKKEAGEEAKVSPIWYLAGILAIWAISFSFLANILAEVSKMLLWVVVGILASASADQVDKMVVKPKRTEYKEYIEQFALDPKAKKRKERLEKAKAEAEAEAQAHQATE